jgi:Nakanori-like protein
MKTGNVIDAASMKAAGLEADIKALSQAAYAAMNAASGGAEGAEEHIIERVNGMKTEYGTGASTELIIYNSIGLNLKLYEHLDVYGGFFKYSPDHDIHNGEWSGLLHVHPAGQAIGSHGLLCYSLEGSQNVYNESIVLMLAWANHYTGRSQCGCGYTNKTNFDTNKTTMYDSLIKHGKTTGTADYGVLGVAFEIGAETSPICRVVASQLANL